MIAIITSTLIPNEKVYSFFSIEERRKQTIKTINSLLASGFKTVYLFDNSCGDINQKELYKQFPIKLIIFHQKQYAFQNKGINEALLLLNNIQVIPKNTKIFKISGRYYISDKFCFDKASKTLDNVEFIGKGYDYNKKTGLLSTRGYFVKNSDLLEDILIKAIEEMYTYASKIRDIRSALKSIPNIFSDKLGTPFQISMEHAFARVIKKNYNIALINHLNIIGYVAGSNYLELIEE